MLNFIASNRARLALVGGASVALAAVSFAISSASQSRQRLIVAAAVTGGDPSRASLSIRRYGCGGCHTIPGIPGADGVVGGPLINMRKRLYVGGVLPNNANNLVHWIVSPPSFVPRTAMPETGISINEARDVAAYLYSH